MQTVASYRRVAMPAIFGAFGLMLALSAQSANAAELRNCSEGLQLFPKDRDLIDPQLLPILETMQPSSGERGGDMQSIRAHFLKGYKQRAALAPAPVADGVKVEERYIPGPKGAPDIRVLIYSPERGQATHPLLLDIHGGSYILGFPEMNDFRNRMLAKELGAVIVSIDYRLAPENKFPAALDDAYAALTWLNANAAGLHGDASKIVIAGDSAGGGIAASLALMVRDKAEIPIKAQVLIYPHVDDRSFTNMDPSCAPGTGAASNPVALLYLGRAPGPADAPQYAFAARAPSLAGVAPAFIAVGAVDGLAEQDMKFAQRLIDAGVPTEMHIYPGAFHGFDLAPEADVTKRFYGDLKSALRRAWK